MSEAELLQPAPRPTARRVSGTYRIAGWLLLLGAGGSLLASHLEPERAPLPPGTVTASGTEIPMLPPGYWEQTRMAETRPGAEFVGPPAPPRPAEKPTTGAGPIGYLGPIEGPLNAAVAAGPVLGPGWEHTPLPNVLPGPPVPPGLAGAPPPAPAAAPPDPTSSELPDEKTVALSRLANPELQVRPAAPVKAEAASPERPLTVRLTVSDKQHKAGEPVTVRVTANLACYGALLLVNAEGKSSTVFQALRPTREYTCLLKAGPSPGTEYLLAVASAQPLSAADLASVVRPNDEFSAPAAWATAVSHLDGIDGSGKTPQRFEWALDTATFVTSAEVVAAKPKTPETPPAAPKPAAESVPPAPKPATRPGEPPMGESVLPE